MPKFEADRQRTRDIVRVQKDVDTLWGKVNAFRKKYPELAEDKYCLEVAGAVIYLHDATGIFVRSLPS